MVTERRQIIFANQDLIDALVEFDRARSREFVPGKAVVCTVSEDEPVRVILSFADTAGDAQRTFEFDANHLAAVLLCFCIKRRIPIPKHARKVLRASGDGLSLNFTLTHENARATLVQTA